MNVVKSTPGAEAQRSAAARRSSSPRDHRSQGSSRGQRSSAEAPVADEVFGACGLSRVGESGAAEERGGPFVDLMDRLSQYRSEEAKLKWEGSFADYFDLV